MTVIVWVHCKMQYIRLARELEGIYTDLWWLAQTAQQLAHAAYTPVAVTAPEVELVACFRNCTPMEHDEPVWEYDFEEWVHCSTEQAVAQACGARPPRVSSEIFPTLAELCALRPPHAERSPPPSGSSPGPSQAEEPEKVPKNTSGGSVVPPPGPPPSSS